jgi:hypothetical protein
MSGIRIIKQRVSRSASPTVGGAIAETADDYRSPEPASGAGALHQSFKFHRVD